jgi:hypothetical protein
MTTLAPPTGAGPRSLAGRLLPWPFVGVSVVLIALILFTPVLFSSGQPAAGTIYTQAELFVDRTTTGNATHIYLHAYDPLVRYASISIGVASGFSWTGRFPTGPLTWTVQNGTGLLALDVATSADTFAVNVTAVYSQGGGVAIYAGLVAFNLSSPSGPGAVLSIAVSPQTPGIAAPASILVSALPLLLNLENFGSGPAP